MREARSGDKSDRTGRKGKPYGTSESLTRLRERKLKKYVKCRNARDFRAFHIGKVIDC